MINSYRVEENEKLEFKTTIKYKSIRLRFKETMFFYCNTCMKDDACAIGDAYSLIGETCSLIGDVCLIDLFELIVDACLICYLWFDRSFMMDDACLICDTCLICPV